MSIRIRNFCGTNEYDYKIPKDYNLRYSSWIKYYRAITQMTGEIKCIIHNCSNESIIGACVSVYEVSTEKIEEIFSHAIVPLCATHTRQNYRMVSGSMDLLSSKNGYLFNLILVKKDIPIIRRPS